MHREYIDVNGNHRRLQYFGENSIGPLWVTEDGSIVTIPEQIMRKGQENWYPWRPWDVAKEIKDTPTNAY